MAENTTYGASLCSGVGALDLSLAIVLDNYRCVLHVEREVGAAEVLAARMEDGSIPEGFIWSDLSTCPAGDFRGVVSILSAGLPCTPYSIAGKQRGEDDDRYIWPSFFRILREMRPAVVLLENVPPFALWFRPIGEELCGMGYRIEAGLFSAEEVGASHKRLRFFALCWAPGDERSADIIRQLANRPGGGLGILRKPSGGNGFADRGEHSLADTDRKPSYLHGRELAGLRMPAGASAELGNATCDNERREPESAVYSRRSGREDAGADCGDAGEVRGGSSEPNGGCSDVADAEDDNRRRGDSGAEAGTGTDEIGRRGSSGEGGELGDPNEPGLEGRNAAAGGAMRSSDRARG